MNLKEVIGERICLFSNRTGRFLVLRKASTRSGSGQVISSAKPSAQCSLPLDDPHNAEAKIRGGVKLTRVKEKPRGRPAGRVGVIVSATAHDLGSGRNAPL